MKTTYNIYPKAIAGITAEFNQADVNTITRGETATFDFEVQKDLNSITYSSDTTIEANTFERYASVTVQSGVTLTVNGTLLTETLTVNGTVTGTGQVSVVSTVQSPFDWLKKYDEWAGKFSTLEMLNGVEKYREQFPTTEPIGSLLLGIEPNADLQNSYVDGVWGLVTNIEDSRPPPLNTGLVSIEVQILAEYSDYADHNAVATDLEV